MRPVELNIVPGVDTDAVALAQQAVADAKLILNGTLFDKQKGFVILANLAQAVDITSAGNLSAVNFTVFGDDDDGRKTSETIAGPNATTVTTTALFLTVDKITVDAAVTSDVEVGVPAAAASFTSRIVPLNHRPSQKNFKVTQSLELSAGATLTYTVQFTVSNINDTSATVVWQDTDNINLIAQSVTNTGNLFFPVRATRVNFTAYTDGSANFINVSDG